MTVDHSSTYGPKIINCSKCWKRADCFVGLFVMYKWSEIVNSAIWLKSFLITKSLLENGFFCIQSSKTSGTNLTLLNIRNEQCEELLLMLKRCFDNHFRSSWSILR